MFEIITSTQNKIVKDTKRLAEKKFRNLTGLFLLEGVNLIKDLPSDVQIEYFLATEARMGELADLIISHKPSDAAGFDAQAEDGLNFTRARVYCVSDEVMKSISDTVSPYGIAAVCRQIKREFVLPSGNALLLDRVSDPGNLGTIFRTAAACGFEDIYLLDTADIYSPKVVRATLGAMFKVRFYEIDLSQAETLVCGTFSAALDMDGENILQSKPETPVLLIAGNEAHGVSEELKCKAKKAFCLPMKNNIESLNVAVAAAVAMYQTV